MGIPYIFDALSEFWSFLLFVFYLLGLKISLVVECVYVRDDT